VKRSHPIPRGKPPKRSTKRIKFSNAYTHPDWRAKVKEVRKRSGGLCEAMICCDGNPVVGDPHHTEYLPGMKGRKRLLVDLDKLIDCCRDCHLEYERRKAA
jgi:hypothetical protein